MTHTYGTNDFSIRCGHAEGIIDGYRCRCRTCGSFFDAEQDKDQASYDASYPELRGHFDPRIGRFKKRTLQSWMRDIGMDNKLQDMVVCEVGFGGGYCLSWLQKHCRGIYGIEASAACIDHAVQIGIPRNLLLDARQLPQSLPQPCATWVFQDSFEHLPHPVEFLEWMNHNSLSGSLAILVLPQANSLSEKLLGRAWPHRTPDHLFHWSREGIDSIFNTHGWQSAGAFTPFKFVALSSLWNHLRLLKHELTSPIPSWMSRIGLRCNIGEMGLLYTRR